MKNFKLILKSLISNPACVEGGRHRPWYFAVTMFVLALLISIVPVFVQTFTKNGDSIVSNNRYGIDTITCEFVEDINDKGLTIKIENYDSGKRMNIVTAKEQWDVLCKNTAEGSTQYTSWGTDTNGNNCWSHKYYASDGSLHIDFQIYLLKESEFTNADFLNTINYSKVTDAEGNVKQEKRTSSYLLISEKSAAMYIQNVELGKDVGSIYGNYNYVPDDFSINSLNGGIGHAQAAALEPAQAKEYKDNTWSNWKKFFVDFYNDTRLNMTWQTTLLMVGINAGLVLFMGLMIWFLTRGKNNPFRIYTIWESMKISAWASISPAILTCGLSFLITSFTQVFFALFLGIRIMWLSMKTLRPDSTVPSQTKYNKPVKTVDTKPSK